MNQQTRRLYDGRPWRKARALYLQQHPLCEYCEARDIVEAAVLVDHKIPHRDDVRLFWDRSNWAACCRPCHDGFKRRIEQSGVHIGCDADGIPLDPAHPWRIALELEKGQAAAAARALIEAVGGVSAPRGRSSVHRACPTPDLSRDISHLKPCPEDPPRPSPSSPACRVNAWNRRCDSQLMPLPSGAKSQRLFRSIGFQQVRHCCSRVFAVR